MQHQVSICHAATCHAHPADGAQSTRKALACSNLTTCILQKQTPTGVSTAGATTAPCRGFQNAACTPAVAVRCADTAAQMRPHHQTLRASVAARAQVPRHDHASGPCLPATHKPQQNTHSGHQACASLRCAARAARCAKAAAPLRTSICSSCARQAPRSSAPCFAGLGWCGAICICLLHRMRTMQC